MGHRSVSRVREHLRPSQREVLEALRSLLLRIEASSAETWTPRNRADVPKSYTFSPEPNAAYGHAHTWQRTPFPSRAFPIPPREPCPSAATAACPDRRTQYRLRTAPSRRRSCD